MKRIETEIPGVCLIEPDVLGDARGFFLETYHREKFEEMGIRDSFVQDNHSRSVRGTLRGLHYQIERSQAKLCRVISGEVLDVVVDVRRGSPTFGRHVTEILSQENKRLIYIPAGLAHGFVVRSQSAEFLYKCSDFYLREAERGVVWNDPELGIDWGIAELPHAEILLSDKDRALPRLSNIPPDDLPVFVPENA